MGLAARGARKLGDQVEQIEDAAVLAQVRRQARQVNIRSALAAAVLTGLALIIPKL